MSMEHVGPQARPALIVLAGPTASGKSNLALRLAEALHGMVINADSMQLYRDLRILTARPEPAAEARAPHRLYGLIGAGASGSAGDWLELAAGALDEAARDRRRPIVVGGTGLYLRALLDGIAPVPPVPEPVRREVRALSARHGRGGLLARIAELDPEAVAGAGMPDDPQRLMRALEVHLATGRPLRAWQADPPRRIVLPRPLACIALLPPRQDLYQRIARRLRTMLERGALEEVRALRAAGIDPSLPLMKAVAVPDLLAHLEGEIELETAVDRATTRTRRYAKRQLTWLRHRMPEFVPFERFGEELETAAVLSSPGSPALRLTGFRQRPSVQRTKNACAGRR